MSLLSAQQKPATSAAILPFPGATEFDFSGIDDDAIVTRALDILRARLDGDRPILRSTSSLKKYLVLHLAEQTHETFGVIFLGVQMQVLAMDDMFRGTLTQTSVYPREVVKRALDLGAANVFFYHNHPTGLPEPSATDHALTRQLKQALNLIDVIVTDHLIVAGTDVYSFAEYGQL